MLLREYGEVPGRDSPREKRCLRRPLDLRKRFLNLVRKPDSIVEFDGACDIVVVEKTDAQESTCSHSYQSTHVCQPSKLKKVIGVEMLDDSLGTERTADVMTGYIGECSKPVSAEQ